MKKIVVFTGAGMSADSGIATFRDADGLWANYRIEDVCTPEALVRNRALVIDFYNMRRREMLAAQPNAGHLAIAGLERDFDVEVVTQNVDDLHERAGSTRVTHLHGELRKLRSMRNPDVIVPIEGWEQPLDATGPDGALLRPHIVFFGEPVPMFERGRRDRRTGRGDGRRGDVAGGLSRRVARALRAARGADLPGRSGKSRRVGHPQSADGHSQAGDRGGSRAGRTAAAVIRRGGQLPARRQGLVLRRVSDAAESFRCG